MMHIRRANFRTKLQGQWEILQCCWLCVDCSGMWCCIDLRRFGNSPWSKGVPEMTGSKEEGVLTGEKWFTNWGGGGGGGKKKKKFMSYKQKLVGVLFVCQGLLYWHYGCHGCDDL